jgi:PucR family transcriptional regulator, purine catabolism regulatory protein
MRKGSILAEITSSNITGTDPAVTIGPLSVAGALALPVLRRALPEVLAGEENLNRAVRWVHVVDVPEPDELLRGGELVLSTGLGPGDDQLAQRRFIRSLADQQAAGLLIEIGYTYKQALPHTLVAEAAATGLPLIATHRPTRFVDITEAIHGALVDRRLAMLRRAQEAGDRMTAIVLDRGDPDALLAELARSLENPVTLENIAGQLVAFAPFQAGEQELLEAHLEYGRVRQPGQLQGPGWLAVEVSSRGRPWGQVTVLQIDSPLVAEDRMVLERGAQALELALFHEQHDEQLRARARGSFLVELMHGRLQEGDAVRRSEALDFRTRHKQLLAGALGWRSERWVSLADTPEEAWAALMPVVRAGAGDGRPMLLGLHGQTLLVIIGFGESAPCVELLSSLAGELRIPLARRGLSEADVAIAFGGSDSAWSGVGRKLDRAANAVLAARATAPSLWRDARHGSLVDLLYTLRRSPELLAFARDQLGPLFEERDQRSRELLRTLEAYLASSGRKAETARALHLTRQSLYLRLERVQRVLGVDLNDPDVLLALHLALRALRLTQALSPEERL